MIQSDKFDSLKMNIKKIANIAFEFMIKRLIEIFGFCVLFIGILLFITLVSYSPEDPNFIFPENTEIKNLLGYQGSFVSDLFLQSIGYISYLIPFTLVFTGINIFKNKSFFLIIENIFFIILYSFFGSLFLSFYYQDAFTLYINGNGGFIGNYLTNSFLNELGSTAILKSIADDYGIPFVILNSIDCPLFTEGTDFARDLLHPGKNVHKTIAERFLLDIEIDKLLKNLGSFMEVMKISGC